jgi:hypothetical protein
VSTAGGYLEEVSTAGWYLEEVSTAGGYLEEVSTAGWYLEEVSTAGWYLEEVSTAGGYLEEVSTAGGYLEEVSTAGGYLEEVSTATVLLQSWKHLQLHRCQLPQQHSRAGPAGGCRSLWSVTVHWPGTACISDRERTRLYQSRVLVRLPLMTGVCSGFFWSGFNQ